MTSAYWPLFDLRITTPDLVLRPMLEADLGTVSDLLPADLELDPAATRYAVTDEHRSRGIITHQGYWKACGTWQPSAWRLGFVVLSGDEIVGFQELEGNDFLLLRTVDTSSFLIPSVRGRGFGKQMRRGAGARVRPDGGGPRSLPPGTATPRSESRALGYQPNGSLCTPARTLDVSHPPAAAAPDWLMPIWAGISGSTIDPCRFCSACEG